MQKIILMLIGLITLMFTMSSCDAGSLASPSINTSPSTPNQSITTTAVYTTHVSTIIPPAPFTGFTGVLITPPDEVLYYHPAGLRWLTDDEINTCVEIALSTPIVTEQL